MWQQCLLTLKPRSRGFHLVTDELVAKLPMLADYRIGMAHLLLQHTSASLTLNENCDPSVRSDMEAHLHRLAPEDAIATPVRGRMTCPPTSNPPCLG